MSRSFCQTKRIWCAMEMRPKSQGGCRAPIVIRSQKSLGPSVQVKIVQYRTRSNGSGPFEDLPGTRIFRFGKTGPIGTRPFARRPRGKGIDPRTACARLTQSVTAGVPLEHWCVKRRCTYRQNSWLHPVTVNRLFSRMIVIFLLLFLM